MSFKSTGIVLDSGLHVGPEPPATVLYDRSRYRSNGDFASDGHPNWVQRPSGLWVLDFDSGTPDYVEISAATTKQLNFTSEDFSIVARVYPDVISTNPFIFIRGDNLVDGYALLFFGSKVLFYTFQSGVWQQTLSTAGGITTANWYTIGISRVGASVKTYLDGVDDTDAAGTHINPATCARSAKIGVQDDKSTQPLDGKIAFLRIYKYALSAGQHNKIHNVLKDWG